MIRSQNRRFRPGKFLVLAFAAQLAWAGGLRAQTGGEDYEVNPKGVSLGGRVMYFRAKDSNEGNLYGGTQLRFHLSPIIAFEGSADYRQTTFPGTTVDIFPVQASLMLYLVPGMRVSPYILGGGGWYFSHVKGPGGFDDTSHRFGPHAGAGLQIFLSRHWSIDGSYRYVWVENIESRDVNNVFRKDYSDSGHMITGAINLHF